MQELIWKSIPGYEGFYEVSNDGQVRSIDRFVQFNGTASKVKGKPKKIRIDTDGYSVVTLCKNGIEKTMKVHRLVAMAFIPNPENKPSVDHLNTIRTDNRVKNLRWVTNKENSNNALTVMHQELSLTPDSIKRGIETRRRRGGIHAPTRVFQFTKDGDFVAEYDTMEEAYRVIGKRFNIYAVLDKENLSAGGYIWRTRKEIKPIYRGRNQNYKIQNILQYDKKGNVIATYKDLYEASTVTGISIPHIVRSIRSINDGYKYLFKLKE